MKILFLNWKSFGNEDVLDALSQMKAEGKDVTVVSWPFENTEKRTDPAFEEQFASDLKREAPDFVLSFNYFPIISRVCNLCGVKYAAWVYDSPHIALYSYTLINPCNYVFLFDSAQYEIFAGQGIQTVYYLPLAASTARLDAVEVTPELWRRYQARIAFVGALYTEAHCFYDRMEPKLDPHTKGYLEGLMGAQLQIDGLNFIEKSLTPEIISGMQRALPMQPNADGVESAAWMYAQYVINRKLTQIERTRLLTQIGEKYPLALYTKDEAFHAKGVDNRGQIDYYDTMPVVFKSADINLNLTLRSIERGIPLRAFDIMGAGGFLLTNYQEDFLHFFVPGEDYVYYESREDLLDKIEYYLTHEDERRKIAESGHAKVAAAHTYALRLEEIMDIVAGGR